MPRAVAVDVPEQALQVFASPRAIALLERLAPL
jgi:hypothetical protein